MVGKIYKKQGRDGKVRYQTWVELPRDPATGKRRQKVITAPTKREVEALAVQMEAAVNNGGYTERGDEKITVAEYLHRWLDSVSTSLRPASHKVYSDLMNKHVIPYIGKVVLVRLSPMDVQRLYTERLKAGMAASRVETLHNVLHKALKQAIKWRLLTHNVTEAVDVPRATLREYTTWDVKQIARFLEVSSKDQWAALWHMAVLTGMRRGEILGLKWADLDLDRGLLAVKRTYSRGAGTAFDFGQPKTSHGRRTVVLPAALVDSLRAHRRAQLQLRLKQGSAYVDKDVVFADAEGNPVHPNTLRKHFVKLLADAGVPPLRFHDLRHTNATLSLAAGVNPKVVSERLGHSNIGITLDTYSHVSEAMQRQAVADIDAFLSHKQEDGDGEDTTRADAQ
jgi:integrase